MRVHGLRIRSPGRAQLPTLSAAQRLSRECAGARLGIHFAAQCMVEVMTTIQGRCPFGPGFDFTNPDVLEKGIPVAEFAELRKTAPVWWNEQPTSRSTRVPHLGVHLRHRGRGRRANAPSTSHDHQRSRVSQHCVTVIASSRAPGPANTVTVLARNRIRDFCRFLGQNRAFSRQIRCRAIPNWGGAKRIEPKQGEGLNRG